MHTLGIFAINLDRSPDRWVSVQSGFSELPWRLHRVQAIDGQDVAATLAYRRHPLPLLPDGVGWSFPRLRMVSLAEEACFCSHLAALRQFLSTTYTHALILEDDAKMRGPVVECLGAMLPLVTGTQLAKLSGSPRSGARPAIAVAHIGTHRLVRSLQPASNAAAYLVTRAGAERLISNAGVILAAYDDYLSAPSLHGCEVLHISPWLITNKGSGSKSTIGSRESRRVSALRDPSSWALQAWRRARIRLGVWWSALKGLTQGRPTFAPWA